MHEVKEMIDHVLEKALIFLETVIAILSVIVMFVLLGMEVVTMFTDPGYFLVDDPVSHYLHNMLNIVIALEFIKLLLHLTPANILEVLTMAIARGIIVNHGTAVDNLLSIACIIGMFAARRYLIPRAELHKGIDEEIPEPHHHHHRGPRKPKHPKAEEHQETPQH